VNSQKASRGIGFRLAESPIFNWQGNFGIAPVISPYAPEWLKIPHADLSWL
jgi:hypothetical protein